ncbi:unnamed protein product [Prunus armeniaca]
MKPGCICCAGGVLGSPGQPFPQFGYGAGDALRAFPTKGPRGGLGGGQTQNGVSSNKDLPGQGVGSSYLGWPERQPEGNLTSSRYSARYSAPFAQ